MRLCGKNDDGVMKLTQGELFFVYVQLYAFSMAGQCISRGVSG